MSRTHASGRVAFCRTPNRASAQVSPAIYDARPWRSRFLQADPVEGGSANDYDYDYVSGDPINAFDLDGRCGWAVWKFWGCGGSPDPVRRGKWNRRVPVRPNAAAKIAGHGLTLATVGLVLRYAFDAHVDPAGDGTTVVYRAKLDFYRCRGLVCRPTGYFSVVRVVVNFRKVEDDGDSSEL